MAAPLGKNLRLPAPKWSNGQTLLSIGKAKAVDKTTSLFWGWHLKVVPAYTAPKIGNDATKNKLATETLNWLNIIGWVSGSYLRCNYYHEYLACEQEDFSRVLRTTVWRVLSYFVVNWLVVPQRYLWEIHRSSHQRFFVKKLFLRILQYSQENTCVGVSF